MCNFSDMHLMKTKSKNSENWFSKSWKEIDSINFWNFSSTSHVLFKLFIPQCCKTGSLQIPTNLYFITWTLFFFQSFFHVKQIYMKKGPRNKNKLCKEGFRACSQFRDYKSDLLRNSKTYKTYTVAWKICYSRI